MYLRNNLLHERAFRRTTQKGRVQALAGRQACLLQAKQTPAGINLPGGQLWVPPWCQWVDGKRQLLGANTIIPCSTQAGNALLDALREMADHAIEGAAHGSGEKGLISGLSAAVMTVRQAHCVVLVSRLNGAATVARGKVPLL